MFTYPCCGYAAVLHVVYEPSCGGPIQVGSYLEYGGGYAEGDVKIFLVKEPNPCCPKGSPKNAFG